MSLDVIIFGFRWILLCFLVCSSHLVWCTSLADYQCDPYANYACLDSVLGNNFISRLFRYYELEMGHSSAPLDPSAPESRRKGWPATPQLLIAH